ncbi:hypothetical protein [Methylibium sp.]|nr:hypothetical protein [Methylibium sp.]
MNCRESIAGEVGYGDAGFFGRLFRHVGMTPARYCKRFNGSKQPLQAPA